MDVVTYGVLSVLAVGIVVIGVFIFGFALGENEGRVNSGVNSRNRLGATIGFIIMMVGFFALLFMIRGSNLHGSIGHPANDALEDSQYWVVSSEVLDDTFALVLVKLNDEASWSPRFHIVEKDCFIDSGIPKAGDTFQIRETRNARFCELLLPQEE